MKIKHAKNEKQRRKLETEYNDYRSFLHKIIKIAKRRYERERFDQYKNDSKSIWSNINAVLGKTNNKTDIPLKINGDNGIELTNINDIVNGFNHYYVNVGPELGKKIGDTSVNPKDYLKPTKHPNSFYLYPANSEEVENIIKLLKPKTSSGHDNISPNILKKTLPRIGYTFCTYHKFIYDNWNCSRCNESC